MPDKCPSQHGHRRVRLTTPLIKLLIVNKLLKLGRLMYYTTIKEYGQQVLKPASAQTYKDPGRQVPKPIKTQGDRCQVNASKPTSPLSSHQEQASYISQIRNRTSFLWHIVQNNNHALRRRDYTPSFWHVMQNDNFLYAKETTRLPFDT